MLHVRNAHEDTLQILEEKKKLYGEKLRANSHFFSGNIDIAKRYLDLVTSAKYRDEKKRGRPAAPMAIDKSPREIATEKPSRRKRAIIIGEIALNPGQSSQQIANKTGIPVTPTRLILAQLEKEGLVEGFRKDKAGYHLKIEKIGGSVC